MFNGDPKTLQRIEPHVKRVLIVDPNPAAARLMLDLMKDCGARDILVAPGEVRAWELIPMFDPQVVFSEYAGDGLDGIAFVRQLRRSDFACRQAPVIMVTAEATLESIKAARDAGVHEFLRKPFTGRDLFKRVENVTLRSRLWVEAKMYVGPDRRRFNSGETFSGQKKRRSDEMVMPQTLSGLYRADAAIRAQLDAYAENPQAALRRMLEKSAELQGMAYHHNSPELTAAVTLFQRYLLGAFEKGRLSRKVVEHHLDGMKALASDATPPEERKRLLTSLMATAA